VDAARKVALLRLTLEHQGVIAVAGTYGELVDADGDICFDPSEGTVSLMAQDGALLDWLVRVYEDLSSSGKRRADGAGLSLSDDPSHKEMFRLYSDLVMLTYLTRGVRKALEITRFGGWLDWLAMSMFERRVKVDFLALTAKGMLRDPNEGFDPCTLNRLH